MLMKRRPARTKRAIRNNFTSALSEMMVVGIDCRSVLQKSIGFFARTVDAIVQPNFCFTGVESFSDQLNIIEIASGVLNLAPAEFQFSLDTQQQRLFAFSFGRLGYTFRDQLLSLVEKHSVRLATLLVL